MLDAVYREPDNKSGHLFASLLHAVFAGISKAGPKIDVFFNAYFDDSGTHSSSKVVAVGGCINYAHRWEDFNKEWQDRITEWGLSHFHMTDWENLRGEYRTWDKPLAERRLRELLDIVYKYRIPTFGWAMARKEFDRITATFPGTERKWGGIYGYLGQQCVRQVRYEWGNFFTSHANEGDSDSVSYFFEDGTPGYGRIAEAWRREREILRWQDILITRVPKAIAPPIQLADIVAYELREMYPMAVGWVPKGELRFPAQQLARATHSWYWSGGTYFRSQILRLADGW